MPERFLLQILRNLVAHGILVSTRGVEGGYMLDRAADEVSVLEVIEAIEGPLVASLPIGEGLPEESRTKLERVLSEITNLSRQELEAIKLSHLLPEQWEGLSSRKVRTPVASRVREMTGQGLSKDGPSV